MFKIGDVICIEKPFAYSLLQVEKDKRCDYCFRLIQETFVQCFKCRSIFYCCRQCQKDGWEIHEKECPVLAERPLSALSRLITRIITRLDRKLDEYDIICGRKRYWSELMDHYNEVKCDGNAMLAFEKILDDLEKIFADRQLDVTEILSIYGKVLVNSFAIQDELFRPIGRGVYIGPSIFDHSCSPNASFTFVGLTLVIKAMKEIPEGNVREKVRISYIDELDLTSERRRQLMCHFYFLCECERCTCHARLDSLPDVQQTLIDIRDGLEIIGIYSTSILFNQANTLEEAIPEDKVDEAHSSLKNLLSLEEKFALLDNVVVIRLADIFASITRNSQLALEVLSMMKYFYGKNHPKVALQCMLTAMIVTEPHTKLKLLNESHSIAQIFLPSREQLPQIADRPTFLTVLEKLIKEAESQITSRASTENKKVISQRQLVAEKARKVIPPLFPHYSTPILSFNSPFSPFSRVLPFIRKVNW